MCLNPSYELVSIVTFFKSTLTEISHSPSSRVDGVLSPIDLSLMALHYHAATAPVPPTHLC